VPVMHSGAAHAVPNPGCPHPPAARPPVGHQAVLASKQPAESKLHRRVHCRAASVWMKGGSPVVANLVQPPVLACL